MRGRFSCNASFARGASRDARERRGHIGRANVASRAADADAGLLPAPVARRLDRHHVRPGTFQRQTGLGRARRVAERTVARDVQGSVRVKLLLTRCASGSGSLS
jgi:hypothetical protein